MATEIPIIQLATPEVIADAVEQVGQVQPALQVIAAWGIQTEAKAGEAATDAAAASVAASAATDAAVVAVPAAVRAEDAAAVAEAAAAAAVAPTAEAMAGVLTNPASAASVAVSATIAASTAILDIRGFGADPTGVTASDAAWAAAMAALPDGGTLLLPKGGTYRFMDAQTSTKTFVLDAAGCTLIRDNVGNTVDEELFIFAATWGTVNLASSMTVAPAGTGARQETTLTLTAAATDLAPGDRVKVFADDFVPASRTSTSRTGWWGIVASVVGATVKVIGGPRDPMTTNIRIARLNPTTVRIDGKPILKRADAWVTPALGGSMIWCRGLTNPVIDVQISRSSGVGIQFSSCYGYTVPDLAIGQLRDTWDDTGTSGAVLAYGVLDTNSFGGSINGMLVSGVRHGFSTAQSAPAAGMGVDSNPALFGITEYTNVSGVVTGAYSAAFDTHEASYGISFDNCTAVGSGWAGFGIRGRNHHISNSKVINCQTGVRIFDGDVLGGESYGHRISDTLIDSPVTDAIVVEVHATGHPSTGARQVGVPNVTLDGVKGRRLRSRLVAVTNGIVDVGNVEATFAPGVGGTSTPALVAAVNSEVRGTGDVYMDVRGVTGSTPAVVHMAGAAGDTSRVELGKTRVRHGAGELDRIVRSSSTVAVAVLPQVLLDVDAAASPDTTDATSIIDWATIVGSTDSARLPVTAATSVSGLGQFGRSLKPTLTLQVAITAAKTLPALPDGRVQGQMLVIRNRSTSTASLTITHGAGGNTFMKGAVDKTVAAGASVTLHWDSSQKWCEL